VYLRVEFDNDGTNLINEIQRLTGLKTYAEVFNNSLTAFHWMAKQSDQGRPVVALDEINNVYEVLDLPALEPKRKKQTVAA
jgi:hypothetical protein